MAFLEDGTMVFTEKCDGLSVRMPSGEENRRLYVYSTSNMSEPHTSLYNRGKTRRHRKVLH